MLSLRMFWLLSASFVVTSLLGCGGGHYEEEDAGECHFGCAEGTCGDGSCTPLCTECCGDAYCAGDDTCGKPGDPRPAGAICYTYVNENHGCEHFCISCAEGDCYKDTDPQGYPAAFIIPSTNSTHYAKIAESACCMERGKLSCVSDDECGTTVELGQEGTTGFCAQFEDGWSCVLGDPSTGTADPSSKYHGVDHFGYKEDPKSFGGPRSAEYNI